MLYDPGKYLPFYIIVFIASAYSLKMSILNDTPKYSCGISSLRMISGFADITTHVASRHEYVCFNVARFGLNNYMYLPADTYMPSANSRIVTIRHNESILD